MTRQPSHTFDHTSFFLDRNGLQDLPRDVCLQLLAQGTIARVGLSVGAMPVVLPVNYVLATPPGLNDPMIIVRSARGTKVATAMDLSVVAVEVDSFDPVSHSGWSVLVQGRSRVVDDAGELEWVTGLPLRPWAIPDAGCCIVVSTDVISGRRVEGHPAPWP